MKLITKSIACMAAFSLALARPLNAEMILSQVIVDFLPNSPSRNDIEVYNSGDERMYIAVEPTEVVNPGLPNEQTVSASDPNASGILVSPRKLVLEPGERRIVRIAMVDDRPSKDRVYRVAIKPVAGPISANRSALKVLVGYNVLVIYRPQTVSGGVVGARSGDHLELKNESNTAQQLFDGQQCDAAGSNCVSLIERRLYPGASLDVPLQYSTPAHYKVSAGDKTTDQVF